MNDLSKRLRDLADKFSEGWHDGIKIDATDIELLADAAAALAEPEQSEPSPFGWVKSSEMETSRRFGGSINLWREKYDCDVPVYLAAPPRREPQCKWPTCQTEEYQQKLSDDVASELIGTPRGEPQHAKHCASLTRLLLSDPPQKARCDCGAEGGKE